MSEENLIKPCKACGGTAFGVWTSSSTGRVQRYCRGCRNQRARSYVNRRRNNGGRHTAAEWRALLAATPRCPSCERLWCDIPSRPDRRYRYVWTKDHIVPTIAGGSDAISNLQPLCYQCNFKKGIRVPSGVSA